MPVKDNKQNQEAFVMGNIRLPYTLPIEVGGYKLNLTYWLPVEEVTVKEYLTHKQEALAKGGITQEQFTFEVRKVQSNGKYIPLNLPQQLVVGQMRLQNRVWNVPLPSIAWELYQTIKKYNPLDRSREGNTNQVVFPNGEKTSIGSFCQLVLGISQTRLAPSGGISGGYSPHKAFEGLIPHGYNAQITSTSPQYSKVLSMIEARKAQELKAKPAPKVVKGKRGK